MRRGFFMSQAKPDAEQPGRYGLPIAKRDRNAGKRFICKAILDLLPIADKF